MAEQILNTRIQLKYDTLANWEANKTKQLKKGEVAIVEVPSKVTIQNGVEVQTAPTVLYKVGAYKEDGQTLKTFEELPWASALAADVYSWAKQPWEQFVAEVQTAIDNGDAAYALASDLDELSTKVDGIDTAVKAAQSDATKANTDLTTHKAEFETFKTNNTAAINKAANDVLGTANDDASKNTVYGAKKAAAAAQAKADENATAISTINTTLSGLDAKYVDTTELASEVNTLNGKIDAKVATTTYNAKVEAIEGRLDGHDSKFATLEGTGEGSVAKAEADAKAYTDQKILDFENAYIKADENGTIDKLNEIASWIADDEAGATKIIADVEQNESDIDAVEGRVDTIEATLKTAELTDTTYTFANGTNGTFTVTPEGGSAQTVDTGAKAYTDAEIQKVTSVMATDNEVAGVKSELQGKIDTINTKIARFGNADDVLVFDCGDATNL